MGIFKHLKRKNKGPIFKICPQCKTANLIRTSYGAFTNTEYYKCRNCQYEGAFYIEYDPNETGENLVDLEELKQKYPEFVETQEELKEKA